MRAPSLAARAGHELAGGLVTAVVALALALSFGLLTFAELGPGFTHYAIRQVPVLLGAVDPDFSTRRRATPGATAP